MGKERQEQARPMDLFLKMVFGGLLGLAVCLLVLILGAAAASKGVLPAGMLSRICLLGCLAGGFSGGRLALRGGQGKTLLIGLGTGMVFFLFLLMAGVILYHDITPLETGWSIFVSAAIGGILSGLAAARPKKRKYS